MDLIFDYSVCMGLHRWGNTHFKVDALDEIQYNRTASSQSSRLGVSKEIKKRKKQVKRSLFCNLERLVNLNGGQDPNWHWNSFEHVTINNFVYSIRTCMVQLFLFRFDIFYSIEYGPSAFSCWFLGQLQCVEEANHGANKSNRAHCEHWTVMSDTKIELCFQFDPCQFKN